MDALFSEVREIQKDDGIERAKLIQTTSDFKSNKRISSKKEFEDSDVRGEKSSKKSSNKSSDKSDSDWGFKNDTEVGVFDIVKVSNDLSIKDIKSTASKKEKQISEKKETSRSTTIKAKHGFTYDDNIEIGPIQTQIEIIKK